MRVTWENGEVTFEPLGINAKSDPVTCAIYARENGLLDLDGWKQFWRLAQRQKKLLRLANQAKLQSFHSSPRYKFGIEIPRNWNHAIEINKTNGNRLVGKS